MSDRKKIEDAVRVILGEYDNPQREGLLDTPRRVAKAYDEYLEGYTQNPREVLGTVFKEDIEQYNQIIILKNIQFNSLCEHHLAPFTGTVDIGYLPNGQVVGLSKLARLVECFARRFQIQERMTMEIANTLMEVLQPQGVAVVVRGAHTCMSSRGVKKHNGVMVTSVMKGLFVDNDGGCKDEFLELCRMS